MLIVEDYSLVQYILAVRKYSILLTGYRQPGYFALHETLHKVQNF